MTTAAGKELYRRPVERVATLPGVEAATPASVAAHAQQRVTAGLTRLASRSLGLLDQLDVGCRSRSAACDSGADTTRLTQPGPA
jgi:hypothetical protein